MIALAIACVALALSAVALAFGYVSWKKAPVSVTSDLAARMQDVEFGLEQLGKRQTGRNKSEGLEVARETFKKRRAAQDSVLSEAQAIIDATHEAAQQPAQAEFVLPADPDQARAAMRARLFKGGKP